MNCATTSQEDKDFDSKLVRLKAKEQAKREAEGRVSIPNW